MKHNLTGQKFGKWLVTEKNKIIKPNRYWWCQCECGFENWIIQTNLLTGRTKGCRKCNCHGKIIHNLSGSNFWHTWIMMKQQCYNPKNRRYPYYGGRNIKVCEKWLKFNNFKEDMYQSYLDHNKNFGLNNTSLCLIDNKKDYEPSNCRWATKKEMAGYRISNITIEFKGKEFSVSQLSKLLGISKPTIWSRRQNHWTDEEIIQGRKFRPNPNMPFIQQNKSLLVFLNNREKKIIELRYGLKGEDAKTLQEIGQMYHLSRERIRQIEAKSLQKLEKSMRLERN